MAGFLVGFSILSGVTAIAYVLFWFRRFSIRAMRWEVLYPTVTIAIFAGGYSLVTVNARYIWLIFVLSMLMGGYVLCQLFTSDFFTRGRRIVLLIIFFVSFAMPARRELKSYANRGSWVYDLSQALKVLIAADSRIAANTNWPGTLFVSYHLGCRYYGIPEKDASTQKLKGDLERYDVDYYFVWGGSADMRFLSDYREITGGRIRGLRVYHLKGQ
jgi:hypothetical protein